MFVIWIRRWLVMSVLTPLLGRFAEGLGRKMETRKGPSSMSQGLINSGRFLSARRRRRRRFF